MRADPDLDANYCSEDELKGRWTHTPGGKLQRTFEQVRALPRRHQELVVRFVDTLVEQQKKAS